LALFASHLIACSGDDRTMSSASADAARDAQLETTTGADGEASVNAAMPIDATSPDATLSFDAEALDGGSTFIDARQVATVTEILAGGTVQLFGVTSDDAIVLYKGTSPSSPLLLYAVPLSGGAPTTIFTPQTATMGAFVYGDTVIIVDDSLATVTPLRAWRRATGLQQLANASNRLPAVSPDGMRVLFGDNMSATTRGFGDLVVATLGTSEKTTLLAQTNISDSLACQGAQYSFLGTVANTYAVSAHCDAPSAVIWSTFAPGTYARTDVLGPEAVYAFASTPAGDRIVAVDGTTTLFSVAPSDSTRTTLDTGVGLTPVFISPDGARAVYSANYALKTVPSSGGALPSTLVAAGVNSGVLFIAPDFEHVAYSTAPSGSTPSDVYVASTTIPGAPTHIASSAILYGGDRFTTDGAYVLYASGNDAYASSVAGGPAMLLRTSSPVWVALQGTYVAVVGAGNNGRENVEVLDVGAGASPVLTLSGVTNYQATIDKSAFVFTSDTPNPGIYAARVP
jgi:hypothetical protein